MCDCLVESQCVDFICDYIGEDIKIRDGIFNCVLEYSLVVDFFVEYYFVYGSVQCDLCK